MGGKKRRGRAHGHALICLGVRVCTCVCVSVCVVLYLYSLYGCSTRETLFLMRLTRSNVSSSPFLSLFSPVSLFFSQGVQEALGGKRRGSTLSKRATWRKQSVGGSEVTLHLAQRRNRLRSMIDSRHMTEFIKAHPVDDNSVKSVTLRRRPSVATKQLMETNSTTGKEKWKMPNMATTQNVTCELVAKIALRSAHRSSMARAGTLPMVHAPYTAQWERG